MQSSTATIGATVAAGLGLASLAAGMGIGRFALTPLLPLLHGVTLAEGSALAAANYAGYLAGAVACTFASTAPGRLARTGLAAVAVATLAMGATSGLALWLVLRFAAGVASALVLVGTASWALQGLALAGRASWAGVVFAGVGTGIAIAGGLVYVVASIGASADAGWLWLGALAAGVAALAWRPLGQGAAQAPRAAAAKSFDAAAWRLVACYAAFGFGYIVPATYLPVFAKRLLDDPSRFGLVWPVFGLAAAASTVFASLFLRDVPPRRVWAAGHVVMGIGVAASTFGQGVGALLAGALCVGGTFMLVTMAGLQEARRVSGESATLLMAAMTSAFALGQVAGPLAVAGLASRPHALAITGGIATAMLFASALVLAISPTK